MDNRAERGDYNYTRNYDRQHYGHNRRPPYWLRNYGLRRPGDLSWGFRLQKVVGPTVLTTHLISTRMLPATTRTHLQVVEDPIADLIIGNHGNVSDRPLKEWLNHSNNDNDRKEQPRYANAVTRGDIRADTAIASVQNKEEPKTELNCLDYNAFRKEVEEDSSLVSIKAKADGRGPYYMDTGLVYKKVKGKRVLVVPTSLRKTVLYHCHDSVSAGHLGINATKKRIFKKFSWPDITADIKS
ncbi:tick transposon [Plakobranchus ocellatus]|uniref:Tick transposon n=1 Tax=Plakobranchus ocellatus TaxID=259542 RepID=A0AAV4BUF6_9GAST|nr:tick transposon [Plakobranchus ocellatus]